MTHASNISSNIFDVEYSHILILNSMFLKKKF